MGNIKGRNGRKAGEVFTDRNAVRFILDEVSYRADKDLSSVKILEPASGKGAFATEIVNRLFYSSLKHRFSFENALANNVRFVEVDEMAFAGLLSSVDRTIESLTHTASPLSAKICLLSDFLTCRFDHPFDCIVGNPPYVRHERIPEEKKTFYKKNFTTFKHRADLYIVFYEKALQLLGKNGILSFICSNRWLNNQYGEGLRSLIAKDYSLTKLLNIERSSPFGEAVVAYPCITTISNTPSLQGGTQYAEDRAKTVDFDSLQFREISAPKSSSWQNLFLDYDINHDALCGIVEQGFTIGIGVATGADEVFIRHESETNEIERNRLIPLLKSGDLRNNEFRWSGHFVINPFEGDKMCDLDLYPRLKRYLNGNRDILLKRHIAQKSPDKWFRTIDKIKLELWRKPKLLLPDLTGNKVLFIDKGNYYPHHNLYYITCENIDDLKILASILMSGFVREQMMQIGVRMNGGLPRFQAQVLKKLKIPNIETMSIDDKNGLIECYHQQNTKTIDRIIGDYCVFRNIRQPGGE